MAKKKRKYQHKELPELNYHLYRIIIPATGQYYFGATTDLEKRKQKHFNCILNRIWQLRHHDTDVKYLGKRKAGVLAPTPQKLHGVIAEFIKPLVAHIIKPGATLYHHYKFELIQSFETSEQVKKAEHDLLVGAKEDPLCMNTIFQSNFNKIYKPKKSAYEY